MRPFPGDARMLTKPTAWLSPAVTICFVVIMTLAVVRADLYLILSSFLFGVVGFGLASCARAKKELEIALAESQAARTELTRKLTAARDANSSKSLFLANMSHEIRTPLSAILGFVELMDDAGLPVSERLAFSKIIRNNSEYLIKVVNDILDISKMESGKLEIRKVPTELSRVVSSVIDMMKVKADEKNLRLAREFWGSFPHQVLIDEGRVRQILVNLISNAIKFTNEGQVTVVVGCSPSRDQDSVDFEIIVRDTGEGIDPSQHGQLFNMFTQFNTGRADRPDGTGIGLALSRRLANLMGGEVALLESAPGKGSSFIFTLPARLVKEQAAELFSNGNPSKNQKNPNDQFSVRI